MRIDMENRRIVEKESASGVDRIVIEHLLDEQKLGGNQMFAKVCLEKGSVLGVHSHHGETETYYILSGEGEYTDNGETYSVKAGDTTFCPDGSSHGLKNTGDGELTFMALIIKC